MRKIWFPVILHTYPPNRFESENWGFHIIFLLWFNFNAYLNMFEGELIRRWNIFSVWCVSHVVLRFWNDVPTIRIFTAVLSILFHLRKSICPFLFYFIVFNENFMSIGNGWVNFQDFFRFVAKLICVSYVHLLYLFLICYR